MNFKRFSENLNLLVIVIALAATVWLCGCAASEETGTTAATQQAEPIGQSPTATPAAQEQPKSADDAALSSFVGEAKVAEKPTTPAPVVVTEIDALRSDNDALKKKSSAQEEQIQTLNAKVTDLQALATSEKERADKESKRADTEKERADRLINEVKSTLAAAPVQTQPGGMMSDYEDGLTSFNKKKYDDAMKKFNGLLEAGVQEDLADNCQYWLGECLYAKKQYRDAIKHFDIVSTYKTSEKKADAQFMLAQSYEKLGNKKKAKEAYEKIVRDYPTSSKVSTAKKRWGKL